MVGVRILYAHLHRLQLGEGALPRILQLVLIQIEIVAEFQCFIGVLSQQHFAEFPGDRNDGVGRPSADHLIGFGFLLDHLQN